MSLGIVTTAYAGAVWTPSTLTATAVVLQKDLCVCLIADVGRSSLTAAFGSVPFSQFTAISVFLLIGLL